MAPREPMWRAAYLAYGCSTCNALPGEPCVTRAGKPTGFHVNRMRLGERCPVCGVMVGIVDEPGTLCDRCALVRALEVERATTYRRRFNYPDEPGPVMGPPPEPEAD